MLVGGKHSYRRETSKKEYVFTKNLFPSIKKREFSVKHNSQKVSCGRITIYAFECLVNLTEWLFRLGCRTRKNFERKKSKKNCQKEKKFFGMTLWRLEVLFEKVWRNACVAFIDCFSSLFCRICVDKSNRRWGKSWQRQLHPIHQT